MNSYCRVDSDNKVDLVIYTPNNYTESNYVGIPYYMPDLLSATYNPETKDL